MVSYPYPCINSNILCFCYQVVTDAYSYESIEFVSTINKMNQIRMSIRGKPCQSDGMKMRTSLDNVYEYEAREEWWNSRRKSEEHIYVQFSAFIRWTCNVFVLDLLIRASIFSFHFIHHYFYILLFFFLCSTCVCPRVPPMPWLHLSEADFIILYENVVRLII